MWIVSARSNYSKQRQTHWSISKFSTEAVTVLKRKLLERNMQQIPRCWSSTCQDKGVEILFQLPGASTPVQQSHKNQGRNTPTANKATILRYAPRFSEGEHHNEPTQERQTKWTKAHSQRWLSGRAEPHGSGDEAKDTESKNADAYHGITALQNLRSHQSEQTNKQVQATVQGAPKFSLGGYHRNPWVLIFDPSSQLTFMPQRLVNKLGPLPIKRINLSVGIFGQRKSTTHRCKRVQLTVKLNRGGQYKLQANALNFLTWNPSCHSRRKAEALGYGSEW